MSAEQALILVILVIGGLLAIMVIGRARQQGAGSKRSPRARARQADGGTTAPIDGGHGNDHDRGQDTSGNDGGGSSGGGSESSGGSDSGGGGSDGGGGGGDS
ncbi:MAG TPA: hypothetical protein VGT61_07325 [Thermomicrobiales bacterium]|jgi:hypothetical protein|nr:hypothetical protein [Thermomicrobiales bacterium]